MKPLRYTEARAMDAAGPFSFIDFYGVRATRVLICLDDVITSASVVEPSDGGLVIRTWLLPPLRRAS